MSARPPLLRRLSTAIGRLAAPLRRQGWAARPPGPAATEPSIAWLLAAFLAVASSFILATIASNHMARQIDRAADDIANDDAPSIEHLSTVRVEVAVLERALAGYAGVDPEARPARAEVEASLEVIDREVQRYLALPLAPGELPLWERLHGALVELKDAGSRVMALADAGSLDEARSEYRSHARPSAARATAAAMDDIDFNARHGREMAVLIKRVRRDALAWGLALDVMCLAAAVIAGLVLARQVRRHGRLVASHARLLEDRAGELESFASRVAHDVLNPVGAAQMAVELALRQDSTGPRAQQALGAAMRNLRRACAIVDGLLRFARAGARSRPGAVAEVAQVVRDVADGLGAEVTRADAQLHLELSPCAAACDAGVLASLVSNLVSNALKYGTEGPLRHVEVRSARRGPWARVEVEDTGPGLARELLPRVFDVYVRGPDHDKPGLGLGLATVKRLVEGHGGHVGVESSPGKGCLFWFELPAAELPQVAPADCLPGR